MDPILVSAASGLKSRMEALDMLANNLANAATSGYKTDRESYGVVFAGELEAGASALPVVERHWTDFSQGALQPTGNSLDVAISGNGFFAVNGPSETLYTRNGSFQISKTGDLTTAAGYSVRNADGGTIRTDSSAPIDIALDGTVQQQGRTLGRLEMVEFAGTSSLSKRGGTYFAAGSAAQPKPASGAEVHQGKVEASNVAAPESAVRLVSLMRQFEMLQRAIGLAGEMNKKVVEDVARVGS